MHDRTRNTSEGGPLEPRDYRLVRRLLTALPERALDEDVLVASSGGPDSTALLELCSDALEASNARGNITAAYVDHGQRPRAARAESAHVAKVAAERGADCRVLDAGLVPGASEAVMREARYVRLEECASRIGATWILTGHTRDDQTETVLLRLFRGAGRRGLGGVPARRGRILRPLLGIRREELRDYLVRRGRTWCEDASNTTDAYARNRLRHRVLPAIHAAFGDTALKGLPELAARWRTEEAFLRSETERYAAWVLTDAGTSVDLAALSEVPEAIRARLLRRWLTDVSGGRTVGETRLRQLEDLARRTHGCEERRIAGVALRRVYDRLGTIEHQEECAREAFVYKVELMRGGRLVGPAAAWVIEVDPAPAVEASAAIGLRHQSIDIDARSVPDTARLRPVCQGDRIALAEGGTRKVRELMVDRRLPRSLRDRWPVWAADAEVLWVPGMAVAAGVEAREPGSRRVRLSWKQLRD